MNVTSGSLRGCYFFLWFYFLNWFFRCTCTRYRPLDCLFNRGCRCLYFSHKLLSFFLFLLLFLINFFLLSLFILVFVFGLSLVEVTIELIPPWATLYIILLIIISIIQISEKIFSLLCPKRVFLLLFFSVDQIIHFGSSSLTKLHIFYSIVFGVNFRSWFRLLWTFAILWAIFIRIAWVTFVIVGAFGRSFVLIFIFKYLISFIRNLPFFDDTLTRLSSRLYLLCWLFSHILYFRL